MELLLGASFVAGCAALCAAPMLARYSQEARIARLCTRRRTLVLTYDDGPGAGMTGRLLDLLRAHGARASFFLLGQSAERSPAIVERAAREGHELGSHSYRHVHAWKSLPWTAMHDVLRGFRSLDRWVARDGLFRPPYGKLTPLTWIVVRARGARFAWWTVDSRDTRDEKPDADRVVDAVRRSHGGVVLMHDFDGEEPRHRYVLELTERLLQAAREDGLSVLPLGELLRQR